MIRKLSPKLCLFVVALLCTITANLSAASLTGGIAEHARTRHVVKADSPSRSVTACVNGMAGSYPCNKIDMLAFLPLSSVGCASSTNTVEGWVDPLNGKEYALLGCDNGTSFIDVTDPVNPVYQGRLPSHNNTSSLWRDIRVYNNYAFVGADQISDHGIQVFDLTQLRNITPPVTFSESARYGGLGNSHTIFLNQSTGFLYAVGSGGNGNTCPVTLHMINVQNPLNPTFAGCFNPSIYTHETQCVTYSGPDTTYTGHEICFDADGYDQTLAIVDVSIKSAPVLLKRIGYAGAGFPHQTWLTEDQAYMFLDDEFDEMDFGHNTKTYMWNVSDLNNPVLIGSYFGPTTSIDHNQYVKGNFLYQSDYTSGIHILDISNVASGNINEVAYFDLWPANDAAQFDGTWDNYPYLPSGILLATSIFSGGGPNKAGLYILQPNINPDFALITNPTVDACTPGSGTSDILVSALQGYTGNVTLSTNGLPAGSSSGFNPNPVVVPGTSTMTVTVTNTPVGAYPFNLHGTDGTNSHDQPMTLNVSDVIPSGTTLSSPPDGATNQEYILPFQWSAATEATRYTLDVAFDPAFTNMEFSTDSTSTSVTPAFRFLPSTTYYWRVLPKNGCGSGPYSSTFSFTTRAPGQVLLVDDDNNDPDVRSFYTSALDSLSVTYDVWDTRNDVHNGPRRIDSPTHINEPDAETLGNYMAIIWFSGDESGGASDPHAGPSMFGEQQLATYLDAGGCLFLSSEEYFNDSGDTVTPFMSNYLGVSTIVNNVNQTVVSGAGSVYGGLGSLGLTYPPDISNLSDRVSPNLASGAEVAFTGNHGNAGINRTAPSYRTVFLGFPFETIANSASRTSIMNRTMTYCQAAGCPTITLSPSTLPNGSVGTPYNQTITASGGTAPYSFSVTAGAVPAGLTLGAAGALTGTPTTNGSYTFTVTANDSAGCPGVQSYTINIGNCLFCDDFEDGVLAANWTYLKPQWTESGGNLIGNPTGKKAIAIATPAFAGCLNCSVSTNMQSAGGVGNKVWVLAWYIDKNNTVELLMKEEQDKWILRHRVNGVVVQKAKGSAIIDPNVIYNAQISFNGTQLQVTIDGNPLISITPTGLAPGTVGFESKNTTASFGDIAVN